jgi:heme exporter protein B
VSRRVGGSGRIAVTIAERDLRAEFRRFYEIVAVLAFAAGSMLIAGLAAQSTPGGVPGMPAIVLWITLFFITILIFSTSFSREADRGTLGGLKSLPCAPVAILAGKVISGTALVVGAGLVLVPFAILFLGLNPAGGFAPFLAVYVLGAAGLSFAGSFVSGLVIFLEEKTILVSFLLLPVCIPVLVPSVVATEKVVSGADLAAVLPEVELLVAFLLLITAIMIMTFTFVLEE